MYKEAACYRYQQYWCYVDAAGELEKRSLVLGRSNDRLVHVQEGLEMGDRVALDPAAIIGTGSHAERSISPDAGIPEPPTTVAQASAAVEQEAEPYFGGK